MTSHALGTVSWLVSSQARHCTTDPTRTTGAPSNSSSIGPSSRIWRWPWMRSPSGSTWGLDRPRADRARCPASITTRRASAPRSPPTSVPSSGEPVAKSARARQTGRERLTHSRAFSAACTGPGWSRTSLDETVMLACALQLTHRSERPGPATSAIGTADGSRQPRWDDARLCTSKWVKR